MMNLAAKTKRPQRQPVSDTYSTPAPIGGWNARDSLATMKETDAVFLENLFPTGSDVVLRRGKVTWSSGLPSTVLSLMPYSSPTLTQLFAASGTAFYNVTAQGAVGAAVVTGLTHSRWQWNEFSTLGGWYLYCVNGADNARLWDGAAWLAVTAVSVPAITGILTTLLVNVNSFKRRLWFVEINSLSAWYLPVDSIGGAATELDLGPIFTLGGTLLAMGTWTLDAGVGIDDYAVFVTSEGQVAVYRGTDPAAAATFALVGVYQLGRPIGYRCLYKYQGDLLIICEDGLFPLSKALLSSKVNPTTALTDKIQPAMVQASKLFKANFGWQTIAWGEQSMLLLNIPLGNNVSEQAVMNTVTGAWCKFTGLNPNCFEQLGDDIYFGGNTTVDLFYGLGTDKGADIVGDALQAFTNLKRPELQKHFTMVRPILRTDGRPAILASVNVDFDQSAPTGAIPAAGGVTGMFWGSMLWGSMFWGGLPLTVQNWIGAASVGYYGAMRVRIAGAGEVVGWTATGYLYQSGGVL